MESFLHHSPLLSISGQDTYHTHRVEADPMRAMDQACCAHSAAPLITYRRGVVDAHIPALCSLPEESALAMITESHVLVIVANKSLPLSQAFVTLVGWRDVVDQKGGCARLDMR